MVPDIGRAFGITAILAAGLSLRATKERLPVINVLANSAGTAAMADLSLAAACTYVDPGYDELFVPEVNPRTWERPTLHISLHCPVALYLSRHGLRRLQMAFYFHSRLTSQRLTDKLVPLSPKRPHSTDFRYKDFRYRSVPSLVMEPNFDRFMWTDRSKRALGFGVNALVASFIVEDLRFGQVAAKPLELVRKGMEFLAAELHPGLAEQMEIHGFAGASPQKPGQAPWESIGRDGDMST